MIWNKILPKQNYNIEEIKEKDIKSVFLNINEVLYYN